MSTPSPARRRWPRVLAAIALALALVIGGFAVWNAVASAPAGEAQAVEFADATISDEIASATVLALGEATHGTSEFQHARLTLLQKVVARGFTTIALEDPAGSSTEVDAWLQGGPGSVSDAADAFGFALYRTQEMTELLSWIREYNTTRPEAEQIRLYGIDHQRPDADKRVALAWLAQTDPVAASAFEGRLAGLTYDTRNDAAVNNAVRSDVADLAAAVEAAAARHQDDAALRARMAALALVQGRGADLATNTEARDRAMAAQLELLVSQRALVGGEHTLLFGHNGHLDRAASATMMPGTTLGQLAAERWGQKYKVIGTDGRRVGFRASGTDGTFTVTVNSPIRGLFTGADVGYVETAQASPKNAEVLARSMPMVSVGDSFAAWQGWTPFFYTVEVVPRDAWDALIYVDEAHPVTPLG